MNDPGAACRLLSRDSYTGDCGDLPDQFESIVAKHLEEEFGHPVEYECHQVP